MAEIKISVPTSGVRVKASTVETALRLAIDREPDSAISIAQPKHQVIELSPAAFVVEVEDVWVEHFLKTIHSQFGLCEITRLR